MSATPRRGDRPRVLLLWPGGVLYAGGNFGVPQLVSLAGALADLADVEIVDLDVERALGGFDLRSLAVTRYDLIGISCYSSYDYLKVMAIAAEIRRLCPDTWLVTGGYHPSARPQDFVGDGAPADFDYVVVGDGEGPLRRLVQALIRGVPPPARVLAPEPLLDLGELRYDWSLLDRYRPLARRVASQAEIYLSRGCPFDCSFCMERAKRETSWRALEPGRAVEEIHRLDRFLDLSSWTLFVTDALFGMKQGWRRAFLEELGRRPCRARKIWLLCRLDRLEREDLALMKRAGAAPGFGLESGDPGQLARIDKARDPEAYLEAMRRIAAWASELGVPFGVNVIVGHPGETEASLRRSAAYLCELFLRDAATHGFLSVDPFRLYPGSPIDAELDAWRRDTGMRVHRHPWWHDGDQGFLSEWIDPSAELDYRRTRTLVAELFPPILGGIRERFAYQGPARDYFLRSLDEQIALSAPRRRLHTLGMWHLWSTLVRGERQGDGAAAPSGVALATVADDAELARVAREARRESLAAAGLAPAEPLLRALVEVPRERFVDLELIAESADDRALPLTADGGSTLSAMHAYLRAFEALALGPGDRLVDLGGGSGYGAALAAELVGPTGSVLSIEIEPSLGERAEHNLAAYPHARYLLGSAHDTALWAPASKIYVSFAVPVLPPAWADALAEGGRLVVPLDAERHQLLTLFEKVSGELRRTELHPVRYVPDRTRR